MASRRPSRWRLSNCLPAVLGLLFLAAIFLLWSLHLQIGDHAGAMQESSPSVHAEPRHLRLQESPRQPSGEIAEASIQQVAGQGAARAVPDALFGKAFAEKIAARGPLPDGLIKLPDAREADFMMAAAYKPIPVTLPPAKEVWKKHSGRSCQNYANEDATTRTLEESKIACSLNDACVAVECPSRQENSCTLRAIANKVPYAAADCYEKVEIEETGGLSAKIHPMYNDLIQYYSFQQVTTQNGRQVNIILVRAPFRSDYEIQLFEKYKDKILFMGISSFEDFPLDAMNPFSQRFPASKYTGMFPGFLHMMHDPEKWFSPQTKPILMSQSDFNLPDFPARDYSIPRKYDFTLSGSDQDVHRDCVGWSSYAKNWSFVKESLNMMCGEFGLTGVLVATKSKDGRKACTIPDSCKGKMIQTVYLDQRDYFNYLKQSRFAYLPQVHDASPRVSTQALSLDVPLLMNRNIKGGWKYLNEKTGEFFHDMSDFRESLKKILKNADIPYRYEPRKWVLENHGNQHSGKRLLEFVKSNFGDRVKLPKGTTLLLT